MKEKNKLLISIIIVVLIIATVVGATYTYWQWRNNNSEDTHVNFYVADYSTDMYANLEGGAIVSVHNLAPVSCSSTNYTSYGIKKTMVLKYKNGSAEDAPIKGTLTITAWNPNHGSIPAEALSKINFSVTEDGTDCNQSALNHMSGTFPGTITAGSTKLIEDIEFITAAANTTTEQTKTYYLWIWIDSSYAHENVGNEISDPLQDLQFTVEWSGSITNS